MLASCIRHSEPSLLDQQVLDHLLPQREIRLLFDDPLDLVLIGLLVGLGPRAVHGRALAAVEQAELDAGGVDRPAHQPAQGVDLADDLPLGDAADGRVAAHLADGVAIGRQQRGPRPEPRSGQRRLGPGMPGADHDHVEIVVGAHAIEHTVRQRTREPSAVVVYRRHSTPTWQPWKSRLRDSTPVLRKASSASETPSIQRT